MKRYISAILIPCLLMQFFGCYSNRYLSNEELRQNHSNNQITITTNDGREFVLNRNVTVNEIENHPGITYCSDFYWLDNSLILSKNKVGSSNRIDENGNKIKLMEIETVELSNDVISKIIVSEANDTTIMMVIVYGIVFVALIAGIIYASMVPIF